VAALAKEKPWAKSGGERHFRKVKVSAVAAMKMQAHAASGVEKGLASANRMPVEVMGLVEAHVDLDEPTSIVVTDCFPLPIEGTETTVMTDNPAVMNHMIALQESIEQARGAGDGGDGPPTFGGWYHSHPFDVTTHSNAFLSATDVSTQLGWQLSEDRAGNPWVALVVDPLRGVAKGRPEVGAFRCYPPAYTPPRGMAPDGEVWADEKARNARWGESCVSYYQMETEFVMSSASAALMGTIARDFMWTRVLSSAATLEGENRDRVPERLHRLGEKVDAFDLSVAAGGGGATLSLMALGMGGGGGGGGSGGGGGGGGGLLRSMASVMGDGGGGARRSAGGAGVGAGPGAGGGGGAAPKSEIVEAATGVAELAGELLRGQGAQRIKMTVFNSRSDAARAELEQVTSIALQLDHKRALAPAPAPAAVAGGTA
jgi:COP9 signalosome complex subunit 5